MSHTRFLARAHFLLDSLKKEQIDTSDTFDKNPIFGMVQKLTLRLASDANIIAPGLTACVATTFLKLGLCVELSQRIALEYALMYKEKNINLIFLDNPNDRHTNHTLVQIGPITTPDYLLIGKNASNPILIRGRFSLSEFLKTIENTVLVDPLLGCAGTSEKEIAPLLTYCEKNGITQVTGVRSYSATPSFVESAVEIKENAFNIAKEASQLMGMDFHKRPSTPIFYVPRSSILINSLFSPNSSTLDKESQPTTRAPQPPLDKDNEPTTNLSFYTFK